MGAYHRACDDFNRKHSTMTKMNIAQRINACMADVDYIQKEKKQGMNYSIVSHDAVTAKVRPILQKHGVVYYPRNMTVHQEGNRTQATFDVRFENMDDRTDFIDVATFGYGVDPQDKGPGKAMSYGVKYSLLKVLGLETGDDPDAVQDARADHKAANDRVNSPEPAAPVIRAVKWEGAYSGKSALHKALVEVDRNIRGCGDAAELEAYLSTPEYRNFFWSCEKYMPHYLEGGDPAPSEFVGIAELLEKTRADFDLIQNNPLRAG